ncbi:serine protease inhibitor Cvsi-2-like [Saccostrea echinata]|uniref:serine protease inhibitor Cvsi-2-like n=1 Tax=Saccostrea echinata TaxID=191078 RepID=UPI002A816EF2|nr:serine protease inhibitor Cvsi-2-like [Saccostrea echinata]
MKATLCLAIIACFVAVVYSEDCRQTSDCVNTACAAGAFVGCSHSARQCTCYTHNTHGIACTDRDTCRASSALHCDRDEKHCVDGFCHCTHN